MKAYSYILRCTASPSDAVLMSYARLFEKPLLFRSFIGLEIISEFNEIYTKIESRYNEHERKRLSSKKKRERKVVGAGSIPFKLKVKEILDAFSLL